MQRRLLFLFDNTHLLLEQVDNGTLPANTLVNLHSHITMPTVANALFAFTVQPMPPLPGCPAWPTACL